ncbi:restriction endonuclease subunit S [bacterium]|nr:restriction endonuclease subunit S [bacterium]
MSIWITDTIESCIDKVIDNRGKNPKNYLTCGQYPVIDNFLIQNEKYPNLCNVTRYLDKDLFNNFLRNYLEKDDVIITLVGNGIGNVSMSPSADVAIVQNTIGLRCNNKLLNNFLYYYLLKNNKSIKALDRGGAQPSINKNDVLNSYIYYPESIDTQNKIAKVLSNYDDLIENNNKRIKILEEMAQKIYKEWFVDFKFPNHETATFKQTDLGEIPSDWEVVLVESLLKRLKAKNKYTQDNVISHGNTIVIDQSTAEFLGFHNNEPDFYANPEKPLIIFGDHTCKMQMLVENFSIGPNVIPITSDTVPIAFLYYLIDSLIETKEYKRHWNDLIAKKVILPTNNLTIYYSKIITPIMATINHLKHKNMNLKQTRNLLLPRLISGEIDVENLEIL